MKLNPEDQYYADENSIQAVLCQYGLELVCFEAAKSGIENTTLFVDTNKGKFVLRMYRQNKKADEVIKEEIRFTNLLAQRALPVPKIVPNTQREFLNYATVGGLRWQWVLMEYMAGEHPEFYSHPLINSMATVQAQMHKLSAEYDYSNEFLPRLTELRETVFINKIDRNDGLDSRLVDFLERAEAFVLPLPLDLPTGICHLDFSKGNVLVDHDAVAAVLDFDDMQVAPYAVCLGFSLYHLREGNCSVAEQEEYVHQYRTIRKLSELEKSILPGVMLFRHYFISSLRIFRQRCAEEDIIKYLEIEQDLVKKAQ